MRGLAQNNEGAAATCCSAKASYEALQKTVLTQSNILDSHRELIAR